VAQVIAKIEKLVQPLLEELGCELVDLEYQREQRGLVLRFFLDKENGINLDDCAMASREISSLMDVENIISTAYSLEVSSPGIERPLKKSQDFKRFTGQLAKIKTITSIDPDATGKNRKTFVGTLSGFEDEDVLLILKNTTDAVRIPLQQIDKANLHYEF